MSIFPSPVLPVEAQIGGSKAEVISATAAPGIVSGVIQVNIRVPKRNRRGRRSAHYALHRKGFQPARGHAGYEVMPEAPRL